MNFVMNIPTSPCRRARGDRDRWRRFLQAGMVADRVRRGETQSVLRAMIPVELLD